MLSTETRLLGVLLPTIALLLTNDQPNPPPVMAQSIAQLLAYAKAAPIAFKDATGKLDEGTRELLEGSVRRALGGSAVGNQAAAAKPQISLRSF